jgi:phosphoglycolate phosphatase
MPRPLVVFDLDGTLVDTAPDLIDTLNLILRREGAAPVAFNEARLMIGGGARLMLERGLKARGIPVRDGELDRLFDQFLDQYAAHIADRSRPFPGVEETLQGLKAENFLLAVCTNKLEWLTRQLLGALDLIGLFDFICGQDTFGAKKPDARVLRQTIASAGGTEDRAVMVGDSRHDIDVARAAGVPVIAVDFGYADVPVAQLGPDRVISRFSALPQAVGELIGPVSPARSRH